jgi:ribonucleoside-triphosphate reductase (thioredoxin)
MNTTEFLSNVIVYSKYAKYNKSLQRRENWAEIIQRNAEMHVKRYPQIEQEIYDVYANYVLPKKVFPSMRSLQFAGKAIETTPNRIFNCAFSAADHPAIFSETMFNLLGGCGVGYSVQKHHVAKLPMIKKPTSKRIKRYLIPDSIEGWSEAIKVVMKSYFKGSSQVLLDYSDIRAKGTELVTAGGKAPGPAPLKMCIDIIVEKMDSLLEEKGEPVQLSTIEVHDILCHISNAVLAGGIRRSALISLFSVDDDAMMTSKGNFHFSTTMPPRFEGNTVILEGSYKGSRKEVFLGEEQYKEYQKTKTLPWYIFEEQRGRANNSAVLEYDKVTREMFDELWEKVKDSGAGEPGVYWTNDRDLGSNPCCEISLKSKGYCNLSEVIATGIDTQEEFNNRAKAAAFLGTLQAGYTNFHYLRPDWQDNAEEESLLGVSMTGIASGDVLKLDMVEAAKNAAEENERIAGLININKAKRITTVKPSGTASIVAGTSSGIHAWHAPFYVRRVRINKDEAIYKFLQDKLPAEFLEDDTFSPATTAVLAMPIKAPKDAIFRNESPVDLMDRVKKVHDEWIANEYTHREGANTHNVSVTVSIDDSQWETVGNWMWDNRYHYHGISVLPLDGGTYPQMPFTDITEAEYNDLAAQFNALEDVNLDEILEETDNTDLSGEAACSGGGCEVSSL